MHRGRVNQTCMHHNKHQGSSMSGHANVFGKHEDDVHSAILSRLTMPAFLCFVWLILPEHA